MKKQAQIEEQMAAQIAGHGLLAGVRRLGVAVSGGSDSVALLRLLLPFCRAAKIKLVVLHLDHGLRGKESRPSSWAAIGRSSARVFRIEQTLRFAP